MVCVDGWGIGGGTCRYADIHIYISYRARYSSNADLGEDCFLLSGELVLVLVLWVTSEIV